MTLQEILDAIDTLPNEDLAQIEERILNRQKSAHSPRVDKSIWEQDWVKQQMQVISQDVEPVELIAGTMNTEAFLQTMQTIHDELSDEEIDVAIEAMNEEYIENKL